MAPLLSVQGILLGKLRPVLLVIFNRATPRYPIACVNLGLGNGYLLGVDPRGEWCEVFGYECLGYLGY